MLGPLPRIADVRLRVSVPGSTVSRFEWQFAGGAAETCGLSAGIGGTFFPGARR